VEPTHEPELTAPVDLCTGDGRRLNPDARGWSRRPLHRANLAGRRSRTKKWDYWAVLAGDLVISAVYADVGYLGLAAVWWAELPSGRSGGVERAVPAARGVDLPELPGTAPLRFRDHRLHLEIGSDVPDPAVDARAPGTGPSTTTIRASWTERSGDPASLEVALSRTAAHESLSVVIPWDDRRFQFTTKDQAIPAEGVLKVGAAEHRFGGAGGEAWGVLDVGRGRWPYSTQWNWGGGAGRSTDGEVIGVQLGGKWTDGTGFTENAITVGGRLHKIGRELTWQYSWERPMDPWRVVDPGGAVDLQLTPEFDRHSRTNALVLRTEVHQVFGTWSGTVIDEQGGEHRLDGAQGFVEESRSRW
jgi:hypothetical protein